MRRLSAAASGQTEQHRTHEVEVLALLGEGLNKAASVRIRRTYVGPSSGSTIMPPGRSSLILSRGSSSGASTMRGVWASGFEKHAAHRFDPGSS